MPAPATGSIDAKDVKLALRALGITMSKDELRAVLGRSSGGSFSFKEFVEVTAAQLVR